MGLVGHKRQASPALVVPQLLSIRKLSRSTAVASAPVLLTPYSLTRSMALPSCERLLHQSCCRPQPFHLTRYSTPRSEVRWSIGQFTSYDLSLSVSPSTDAKPSCTGRGRGKGPLPGTRLQLSDGERFVELPVIQTFSDLYQEFPRSISEVLTFSRCESMRAIICLAVRNDVRT